MQLEIDDNVFWLSLWVAIILGFVIALAWSLDYSNKTNAKILQADTCEKVMAINGSYTEKYMVCVANRGIEK